MGQPAYLLHRGDALNAYAEWPAPTVIISDGAYGLASFPGDDPSLLFEPAKAVAVIFEIGGGAQRTELEIQRAEASAKKLFGKITPWAVLLENVADFPARYEKYSNARKADLFRREPIYLPDSMSEW